MRARNVPTRLATGAYVLHSGWGKWRGTEDQARGVHGMAARREHGEPGRRREVVRRDDRTSRSACEGSDHAASIVAGRPATKCS